MKKIDSWRSVLSWLDEAHGGSIQGIFPGFWSKWKDDVWQDGIESAIYWYVLSNDGASGIDASVILAQAALERLCWTVYVETNGGLSKAGFKRLPAADQLRLLLAHVGIPLSIPDELQELRKLARQFNWDGADAFVNLRNSLVHPGHSNEADFSAGDVMIEGWRLGMWYLELILLHLFDYDGVYSLRLKPGGWVGEVENVPWSIDK